MYEADLQHPENRLQEKLKALYELRPAKSLTLGFRPEFLQLLEALGNPHRKLPPTIHIAGTNGKGSTVATLKALLEASGKTVHTYTSPHLKRFNERIVLAGEEITDADLERLIDKALLLNAGHQTTFFEITTAIAFAAFAETPADVLLLETGLGGRLDCTNVIEQPIATIITSIGYDHQEYLGETLEEIASEKAGIMKAGVPCILGAGVDDTVLDVFRIKAAALNVPLSSHDADWRITPAGQTHMIFSTENEEVTLPCPNLVGAHQIANAGTALAALWAVKNRFGWPVDKFQNGLERIVWPARFQKIHTSALGHSASTQIEFWYDGGHNVQAARVIAAQLEDWTKTDPKSLHLIFGMKGDKDAPAFLETLIPHVQSITHIDIHGVGGFMEYAQFENLMKMRSPSVPINHAADVPSALLAIRNGLGSNERVRVLLCGSLYLAKQLP
jgi:dihydrofolate synthase/folylpolyglutamate synthase